MKISEEVKRRLRAKLKTGVSQAEAAASCGLNPSVLSRWLAGRGISGDNLDAIAKWLRVTVK